LLASQLKISPPAPDSLGALGKWEGSSDATPSVMVDHLCRAIDVLEASRPAGMLPFHPSAGRVD